MSYVILCPHCSDLLNLTEKLQDEIKEWMQEQEELKKEGISPSHSSYSLSIAERPYILECRSCGKLFTVKIVDNILHPFKPRKLTKKEQKIAEKIRKDIKL